MQQMFGPTSDYVEKAHNGSPQMWQKYYLSMNLTN